MQGVCWVYRSDQSSEEMYQSDFIIVSNEGDAREAHMFSNQSAPAYNAIAMLFQQCEDYLGVARGVLLLLEPTSNQGDTRAVSKKGDAREAQLF